MTSNPLTQEDPTVHAVYAGGQWRANGRNLTTRDVTTLQENFARKVEQINGRRALSAEAKRIEIARAYRDTREQIQAAGQMVVDHVTTERARLSRKLFGYEGTADAQTVIIRRDAADRASKLTDPAEAQRAIQRAENNGDVHLAQAIAGVSFANGWTDVVQTWFAANPQAGDTAQQLSQLPDPSDGVWRMQHAMTYSVVPPEELSGLADYQVDRLADTDLDGDTAA
ncbi:hypothetical protein AB0N62_26005 [Streptomyces sp. NPDC093982]|uniref:hypothetical protein n=1 Tax=Streptomyces sp. NPDC093982 TaxID=3155077 RepID=UPI003434A32D